MSVCWACCWSGSCVALHRDGVAHAQWCCAEGHQMSPVRSERLPLPSGHTAVYSRGARGTAASSSPARVTLSVRQWAVAGHEQMCRQKQECLPWARTAEGVSSEPRAQGKPAGADAWPAAATARALWLQPVWHAACPARPRHTSLLSSPRCHHLVWVLSGVVFPPDGPHSPPLPFCLEKEGQKGSLSQIRYLRPPWWQPVTPW